MLTLVLVIILTALVAVSITYIIKYLSYSEEEQLPIENPEVIKPTLVKKAKTKNSNNLKLKK